MIIFSKHGKTAKVVCDDCEYSPPDIPPGVIIDESWTPPVKEFFYPSWYEIDVYARSYGVQWFSRGRALKKHLLDKPSHLCDNCRKKRLSMYYNRSVLQKMKDSIVNWWRSL